MQSEWGNIQCSADKSPKFKISAWLTSATVIILLLIITDIFTFTLDILYAVSVSDSPAKHLAHATQQRFYTGNHHPLGIRFALEIKGHLKSIRFQKIKTSKIDHVGSNYWYISWSVWGCYDRISYTEWCIHHRNSFLTVLKARMSKIKMGFLVPTSCHRHLSSCCALAWPKGWGSVLGSLLQGPLCPSWGLSLHDVIASQRPPPPNSSSMGIRFQHMNLEGSTKHSVYRNIKSDSFLNLRPHLNKNKKALQILQVVNNFSFQSLTIGSC